MSRRTLVLAVVAAVAASTVQLIGPAAPAAAEPLSVTIAGQPPERARLSRRLACRTAPSRTSRSMPTTTCGRAASPCRRANWEYKAALDGTWDENYGAGRGARRPQHRARRSPTGADVKFYLRPRDPLGHRQRDLGDRHGRPAASRASWGARATGIPGCLRSWLQDPDGDGIATVLHLDRSRPAPTRRRSRSTRRGTRTTAPAGVRDGAEHPVRRRRARRHGDVQLRPREPRARHHRDPGGAGGRRRARAGAGAPPVRRTTSSTSRIPTGSTTATTANNCGDYAGACVAERHAGDTCSRTATSRATRATTTVATSRASGASCRTSTTSASTPSGSVRSSRTRRSRTDTHRPVRPLGRLPRVLDPRLPQRRPAPRDQRGVRPPGRTRPTRAASRCSWTSSPTTPPTSSSSRATPATGTSATSRTGTSTDSRSTTPTTPTPASPTTRSRRWTRARSRTRRSCRPARRTRRTRPGSTTRLLYHNRGNTTFTGENSLYGDFFGLDDLWTERQEVVDGMIDIYKFWIDQFGVDGFRIDTTKHVNMEFWQKFGPDIVDDAQARGIPDFFAFGEVFDQQFGPQFMSEFSTRGKLQSTIDFGFQLAARDFASQERGHRQPDGLLRHGRLLHRHRQQRVRHADVPRQPRHGAHRLLPAAGGPARRERRRAARPIEAGARADVLRPRPAGHLLRRRAGLHRRRRRQGRPRGHVRQRRAVVRRQRPDRHRRDHVRRQLRPHHPLYQAIRGLAQAPTSATRRCGPARRSTATAPTVRASTRSPASTATSGSSTSSR